MAKTTSPNNHMKKNCLAVAVILFSSVIAVAQAAGDAQVEIQQLQAVTGALISKPVKATVLFRDLTVLTGYVTRLDADTFVLSSDKKGRSGFTIAYTDVVGISSKRASVSLIPDPKATPYGNWADLQKVLPNTLIEVTNKNGEVKSCRFRSNTADHLVIAERETNDQLTLKRADVAFVHRVRYGVRDIAGGLNGGTNKGAKIGKEVAGVLGGVRGPISGQPLGSGNGTGTGGHAMGAGVGALVGLIKGAAGKTKSVRVLIYSQ